MKTSQVILEKSELLHYYRQMLLIRRFEEKAAEMYTRGKIGGFLHLYIGEEAVAVGAMAALAPQDYIVTHYREHGHALARGMDPKTLMAELFGKATGCSRGKGGSMHLFEKEKGFLGGYAIVGGQMPIGVGLALGAKTLREDRVTVVFLGDGAVNEGEFHESLNLAVLWNLPVIFICENNGYGMGTPKEQTISSTEIYLLAAAYNMESRQIDGMNVLTVQEAMQECVDRARSGKGPSFLEIICYRYRGHSMADPAEYRKKTEEDWWKKRDPLLLFRMKLEEEGAASRAEFERIEQEVEAEVEAAVQFAEESPFLPVEAIYENVYWEKP